jgi:hypothetical protein
MWLTRASAERVPLPVCTESLKIRPILGAACEAIAPASVVALASSPGACATRRAYSIRSSSRARTASTSTWAPTW